MARLHYKYIFIRFIVISFHSVLINFSVCRFCLPILGAEPGLRLGAGQLLPELQLRGGLPAAGLRLSARLPGRPHLFLRHVGLHPGSALHGGLRHVRPDRRHHHRQPGQLPQAGRQVGHHHPPVVAVLQSAAESANSISVQYQYLLITFTTWNWNLTKKGGSLNVSISAACSRGKTSTN